MSERESKCTVSFKITFKKNKQPNSTNKPNQGGERLNSENYKTYKGN